MGFWRVPNFETIPSVIEYPLLLKKSSCDQAAPSAIQARRGSTIAPQGMPMQSRNDILVNLGSLHVYDHMTFLNTYGTNMNRLESNIRVLERFG